MHVFSVLAYVLCVLKVCLLGIPILATGRQKVARVGRPSMRHDQMLLSSLSLTTDM